MRQRSANQAGSSGKSGHAAAKHVRETDGVGTMGARSAGQRQVGVITEAGAEPRVAQCSERQREPPGGLATSFVDQTLPVAT